MTRTSRTPLAAIAALLVAVAVATEAQAAPPHRGGMVGRAGGHSGPSFGGSPSHHAPMSRPSPGMSGQSGNFRQGNFNHLGGGGAGAGAGAAHLNRPGGNGFNPGTQHPLGGNGIGNRPAFGGMGGNNIGNRTNIGNNVGNTVINRPNHNNAALKNHNLGNRPGGIVGNGPGGGNRPGLNGDNLGVVHRQNLNNNHLGNRTNIGNNVGNTAVNRNNIGNTAIRNNNTAIRNSNTVVNRTTNVTNITNVNNRNFTNFNRPGGYGGYRPGYGYGGYRPGHGYGYGYGAHRPGYGGWYAGNPYAAYHRGWVNGYWNGNYRSSGWGWGNSARGWGVGIGVAAWGIGSLFNAWGYSNYVNPYYYAQPAVVVQQPTVVVQQPPPIVYDYSRPIDLQAPPPSQEVVDQAVATLDSARNAYRAGDYAQALSQAEQALRQTPNDPMLHEFRALCLFAMGRYDEAAVPMYTVLSAGPGWDWTTLAGLYPDINVYTQQLRALESYCTTNTKAASARFLLAALYLTQGSNDGAAVLLKQVVDLQPQDRLSAQLLATLTAKPPAEAADPSALALAPPANQGPATATEPAPAPAADQAPPAPMPTEAPPFPAGPVPAKLVGSWTANPVKDVTITLSVESEKAFTWKVVERGQPRSFKGDATFDKETLALAPPDQPPMVGTITWKDADHFQFKAVGAPPEDPGLNFSR